MLHLIRGVRDAIDKHSWYGGLALALTVPDVCAVADTPSEKGVGKRYKAWAERWVTPAFVGDDQRAYLTADDLYGLRCAFLHAGQFEIDDQQPTAAHNHDAMFEELHQIQLFGSVEPVTFGRMITSTPGSSRRTVVCSLGVRELCEAICTGADSWLQSRFGDPELGQRLFRLMLTASIMVKDESGVHRH